MVMLGIIVKGKRVSHFIHFLPILRYAKYETAGYSFFNAEMLYSRKYVEMKSVICDFKKTIFAP